MKWTILLLLVALALVAGCGDNRHCYIIEHGGTVDSVTATAIYTRSGKALDLELYNGQKPFAAFSNVTGYTSHRGPCGCDETREESK